MKLNSQGFDEYGFFAALHGSLDFIFSVLGALLPFVVIGLVGWLVVRMIQERDT
jgi:uncharacterized membrane protein